MSLSKHGANRRWSEGEVGKGEVHLTLIAI